MSVYYVLILTLYNICLYITFSFLHYTIYVLYITFSFLHYTIYVCTLCSHSYIIQCMSVYYVLILTLYNVCLYITFSFLHYTIYVLSLIHIFFNLLRLIRRRCVCRVKTRQNDGRLVMSIFGTLPVNRLYGLCNT